MKITMLFSFKGTFDGVRIGPFVAGNDYEVDADLADRFINSAMAVEWSEPVAAKTTAGSVFGFSSDVPATFDAEGFAALAYTAVNATEAAE